MKPRLSPGLELFFGWFEEAFFEFYMLLAFLDDVVAVVAAEVGEPGLSDDGFAVGGGGFEVAFGDPSGDGLFAVAEENICGNSIVSMLLAHLSTSLRSMV